jgi:hypothetical protein
MYQNVTYDALLYSLTSYYRTHADGVTRFGQYFCNRYLAEGETWPELFYETNNVTASQLITDYLRQLV